MRNRDKTTNGMKSRRNFMKVSALLTACLFPDKWSFAIGSNDGDKKERQQNKRDLVLSVLDMSKPNRYIPAAFFMHFGGKYNSGQAAVDRHLEYFRATDMDFIKLQYELSMPRMDIKNPSDWTTVPVQTKKFFEPMLTMIENIVKSAKQDALILPTLYSPFMCAKQIAGTGRLLEHTRENPDAVAKGMEIITESLMNYVKASIKLGVDGFYTSTQGGEINRVTDSAIFDKVVRPFDMALMTEANDQCLFNILHICDYEGKYADLAPYVSYPGHVVNTPISLSDGTAVTHKDAAALFMRPVMGGLNRLGEIAKGDMSQILSAVEHVLKNAPDNFILGADCTVPSSTSWETLRSIIQCAHTYREKA